MNPLKSTVLKWGNRLSPKVGQRWLQTSLVLLQMQRGSKKTSKVALLKVFPNELEAQVCTWKHGREINIWEPIC